MSEKIMMLQQCAGMWNDEQHEDVETNEREGIGDQNSDEDVMTQKILGILECRMHGQNNVGDGIE